MEEAIRKTAHLALVGADAEQFLNSSNNSITAEDKTCNDFYVNSSDSQASFTGNGLRTVTMNELLDTVYTGKEPIIDGLLYRDTYLFTGSPKVGKSFFMTQLAYHVSTGTPRWGYPVRKGKVLYLALEDSKERLQSRLHRMFGEDGTDDLYLTTSSGGTGKVLEGNLIRFLSDNPDTSLVILDTLKKIREKTNTAYSYDDDYETVIKLKNFADRRNICLIIVHHNRKLRSDDVFEMISGTNGLFGAADGAFVLDKENRGSDEATLYVAGRDQPDAKLQLKRNTSTLAWELIDVDTESWKDPPDPLLDSVAALVSEDRRIWQGSPTELAAALNTDLSVNALTRKLNVYAQKLRNDYSIIYRNTRNHDGRTIRIELNLRDDM